MGKGLGVWMVAALLMTAAATAQDAATAFRVMSPSVVVLRDTAGAESGVAVTADGKVLTSLHALLPPLPREVVATVRIGGRDVRRTLKIGAIVRVHPTYDMAVVQVELPEGGALLPAKRAEDMPEVGSACYKIGFSGGAGAETPDISSGIISAVERKIDGLGYLQTTAPINPGDTGGAICDGHGQLLGIVAFKQNEADGLGFAIRTETLRLKEMVPLAERKTNAAQLAAALRNGDTLWRAAIFVQPFERAPHHAASIAAYAEGMLAAPNEPTAYMAVAKRYQFLRNYEHAALYFGRALELEPTSSTVLLALGELEDAKEDYVAAAEYYRRGLASGQPKEGAAECALKWSAICSRSGNRRASAYLARWMQILDPAHWQQQTELILANAKKTLPPEHYLWLVEKNDDFSIAGMERFVGNEGIRRDAPPTAKKLATQAQAQTEAKRKGREAAAAMTAAAPRLDRAGVVKKLPGTLRDVLPARYGSLLLLVFADKPRVGVFNLATGAIDRYLPVQDLDCRIATGGNTLAVFYPKTTTWEIWDLLTFEPVKAGHSRIDGLITDIVMGIDNGREVFVVYTDKNDGRVESVLGVVDLDSWYFEALTIPPTEHYPLNKQHVFRANADGTLFTAWMPNKVGGFHLMRRDRTVLGMAYNQRNRDWLLPAYDTDQVFTANGTSHDPSGRVLQLAVGQSGPLYPIHGSDHYMMFVMPSQLTIHDPHGVYTARVKMPEQMILRSLKPSDPAEVFSRDRVFFGSAISDRVAVVDNTKLQITLLPLGLPPVDQKPVPVATIGQPWEMLLSLPAGTQVTIDDGPKGITWDAARGALVWAVPQTTARGQYALLVNITEPDKPEYYREYLITVK